MGTTIVTIDSANLKELQKAKANILKSEFENYIGVLLQLTRLESAVRRKATSDFTKQKEVMDSIFEKVSSENFPQSLVSKLITELDGLVHWLDSLVEQPDRVTMILDKEKVELSNAISAVYNSLEAKAVEIGVTLPESITTEDDTTIRKEELKNFSKSPPEGALPEVKAQIASQSFSLRSLKSLPGVAKLPKITEGEVLVIRTPVLPIYEWQNNTKAFKDSRQVFQELDDSEYHVLLDQHVLVVPATLLEGDHLEEFDDDAMQINALITSITSNASILSLDNPHLISRGKEVALFWFATNKIRKRLAVGLKSYSVIVK